MIKNNFLYLILIFLLFFSCAKEEIQKSVIKEKSLELQVFDAYKEGKKSLDEGDVLFAAKKFNEAETLFPQSEWAPKAALMAAYSYYAQDYYGDAIAELKRFLRVYPYHQNLDYVYYLLGICYYEQIVDEKKDTQAILQAKEIFNSLNNKYPSSDYSIDAKYKLDLIDDILASKEMYIARYYFNKKKWIPAINRFKTVIEDFDSTIYTEEALHRLVELYYKIGLEEEAKKYAQLLGYNYQSSKWYEMSYSLFDKNYKQVKIEEKKDKSIIIKKFKSLFE